MNKREKCEAIYADLIKEGAEIPEGRTIRSMFLERAVLEAGMTEAGAGTYYINAKKKFEGTDRAEYHRNADDPLPNVTKWSIVKIEDGVVTSVWPHPTEDKAIIAFETLRGENKKCCVIVPGTAVVGEKTTRD